MHANILQLTTQQKHLQSYRNRPTSPSFYLYLLMVRAQSCKWFGWWFRGVAYAVAVLGALYARHVCVYAIIVAYSANLVTFSPFAYARSSGHHQIGRQFDWFGHSVALFVCCRWLLYEWFFFLIFGFVRQRFLVSTIVFTHWPMFYATHTHTHTPISTEFLTNRI